MADSDHFLPLFDEKGNLYAVMLSAELWNKGKNRFEPLIRNLLGSLQPDVREEPLHEWDELVKYWDFRYPVCADVQCGNCGAKTDDWLNDPAKPFRLKSAQWAGLAVFSCAACGATVRKKHFKDHYCFEFSIGSCG